MLSQKIKEKNIHSDVGSLIPIHFTLFVDHKQNVKLIYTNTL